MNKLYFILICTVLIATACGKKEKFTFTEQGREVPAFNADSAYHFVDKQVENGPRIPNSDAHKKTKQFISQKLKEYAGVNSVFVQEFQMDVYDNNLELYNIIAAFNPTATDRVMLGAHWDTRPRADEDSVNPENPIDGADDGGSGVGVLLELARIFSENPPPIGIDIILFDGEDYGLKDDLDKYFLGSRYWANNPPVPGYKPRFGILLDMVGSKNAVFNKEKFSMSFAPGVVNEIWDIAHKKGYSKLFPKQIGGAVLDDHYIVYNDARIPMIDIIHHTLNEKGNVNFPPHWHKHTDNMDVIDKNTLNAVGNVLLEFIYNRL